MVSSETWRDPVRVDGEMELFESAGAWVLPSNAQAARAAAAIAGGAHVTQKLLAVESP